ncbi:MAG: hypothetical protein ABSG94_04320 [Brevinematales bacterium]|jgi:hypothetical protein
MKVFSCALFFIFIYCGAFAFNVIFPEFYAYSEYNSSNSIVSSYLIDMVLDTGLKYGVKIGIGLKEYNISSIPTNNAGLDSIKVYLNPVDSLNIGYFIGKNLTLGIAEIGYQGFQFHQAAGLEYIGYKDINGTGIEAYMDFMDDLLQPHLYIYQPSDTNQVNIDTVWYLNLEHYIIQAYFGINNANIIGASSSNALAYRVGFFVKTVYGKIDFLIGLYAPDTLFSQIPSADAIYLNVTEHIVVDNFEQTMTVFTRPTNYNDVPENISNDFDLYLATGVKIDDIGAGIENSLLFASNYATTDRLGLYFYFMMDNLMYKTGIYYDLFGNAFSSQYGGFVSISGNI